MMTPEEMNRRRVIGMRMMTVALAAAILGAAGIGAHVAARSTGRIASLAPQETRPTCSGCPATYISNDEVQAFVARGIARGGVVADQQMRAVNIGKSNVDIGLVYRGRLSAPAEQSAAEHDLVSEVYHIIDGSGTLVTGPDLVNAIRRPAENENVRLLNGPGNNAASIRNGVTYQLNAGDAIVIPAGTGHWFTRIDDHITYLMVRVDPDKVTPLKDEAAARADLRGGK